MKARLFLLVIIAILLCGCGTSYYSTSSNQFSMGKTSYISNYRVLQTINTHFVLATDTKIVASPMIVAIRTSDEANPFYDNQMISGGFVMVDTYTYDTVPDENGRSRRKTVPLLIPKAEYQSK